MARDAQAVATVDELHSSTTGVSGTTGVAGCSRSVYYASVDLEFGCSCDAASSGGIRNRTLPKYPPRWMVDSLLVMRNGRTTKVEGV
jgi:hypothetical protein